MRCGVCALAGRDRTGRGAALPMVVATLAALGALVASGFWMGILERRAGVALLAMESALGEAETAVIQEVAGWNVARNNALPVGGSLSLATTDLPGARGAATRIRRLTGTLFLVASRATSPAGPVQTAGLLVRLQVPDGGPTTPLWASGPVVVSPLTEVGSPAGSAKRGCTSLRDLPLGLRFGDGRPEGGEPEDFAGWIPRTTKVVQPGRYARVSPTTDGATCRIGDPTNWGDPLGASSCSTYRPVVHVPGDLVLAGGRGQGVLLVAGDLTVRGGFAFEGLILVGGAFRSSGGPLRIVGALQAGLVGEGGIRLGGAGVVVHSRCSLIRAAMASARAMPLGSHAWMYGLE
jgi:hypothetical protein